MRNKSVMAHSFSRVPQANIPRSVFKRISGNKLTFNEGEIIPLYRDEVLPGDTFNMHASIFARLATPIKPIMDNMVLDTFWFFVPNRLVWTNWVNFMGEKVNPDDTTTYTVPQTVAPAVTGWTVGSLYDYLGLPTGVPGVTASALFPRAYNLIYNTWFKDQNLIDSAVVDMDSGPDTVSDYVIRKSGKAHDYFTSCLPWPQKGPGVELPLGTTAPVAYDGINTYIGAYSTHSGAVVRMGSDLGQLADSSLTTAPLTGLYTDLSNATAATINSLREAFQIQKMYEKEARGGTRYVELIYSHYGVVNPDFRVQRPEFLGSGRFNINISTVPQTSVTASTPQGNLAAFGTIIGSTGFTKSFTEHGMVFCLGRVRSDLNYQQGLHRMFSRLTKHDFYFPALAHLGEQAVLNKEIYAQGTGHEVEDNAVFGYQERWAEYRYAQSQICGALRSTYATSLDIWHLAQEFESLPVLDQTFIEENAPMDRVIAVSTEPHFIADCYFKNIATRPMPVFSKPGFIDHF